LILLLLLASLSATFAATPRSSGEAHSVERPEDPALQAALAAIVPSSENLTVIGRWHDGPSTVSISSADGEQAFHGRGSSVEIIPIGNMKSLAPAIGSVRLPGRVWGLELVGDLLYVADGFGGLRIVDVADHAEPAVIGGVQEIGDVRTIVVVDDVAIVAFHEDGIATIDVSDPAAPYVIGTIYNCGIGFALARSGDNLFLAHASGVRPFDISAPRTPVYGTNITTQDWSEDVAVSGHHLFVPDRGGSLRVFDVSDPAYPVQAASLPQYSGLVRFAVEGATAIARRGGAVMPMVLDISDPLDPITVTTIQLDQEWPSGRIAIQRGIAHLPTTDNGLEVYDMYDPANPILLGRRLTPGSTRSFDGNGKTAVAASGQGGAWIVDLTESNGPVSVSMVPCNNNWHVSVAGVHALAASFLGWRVVNIADPHDARQVGYYHGWPQTYSWANHSQIVGNIAYLAYGYEEDLHIVDLESPDRPMLLSRLPFPGFVQDVTVADGLACITSSTMGLRLLDVADPKAPALRDSFETNFLPRDVLLVPPFLYVTNGDNGRVDVWDVSRPDFIFRTSQFVAPARVGQLAASPPYLYVSSVAGAVYIYDLADPEAPELVGHHMAQSSFWDLAAHGDTLYVSCASEGGLILRNELDMVGVDPSPHQLDETPGIPSAFLRCRPNPTNPGTTIEFAIVRDDRIRVDIIDLRGRIVAVAMEDDLSAGTHSVYWNGRDRSGRRVASGQYLARLEGETVSRSVKIAVVQ